MEQGSESSLALFHLVLGEEKESFDPDAAPDRLSRRHRHRPSASAPRLYVQRVHLGTPSTGATSSANTSPQTTTHGRRGRRKRRRTGTWRGYRKWKGLGSKNPVPHINVPEVPRVEGQARSGHLELPLFTRGFPYHPGGRRLARGCVDAGS